MRMSMYLKGCIFTHADKDTESYTKQWQWQRQQQKIISSVILVAPNPPFRLILLPLLVWCGFDFFLFYYTTFFAGGRNLSLTRNHKCLRACAPAQRKWHCILWYDQFIIDNKIVSKQFKCLHRAPVCYIVWRQTTTASHYRPSKIRFIFKQKQKF